MITIRLFSSALLLVGLAVLSAEAQTALAPVEPKVSCASLRGFDPRVPGAPTQITDAREVTVDPEQGGQQAGQPVGFQGAPPGGAPNGPPDKKPDNTGTMTRGTRMCVVEGYVSPQIRFEVRLPLQGWTQRYLQTGCGGLCGSLRIEAPQRPCRMLEHGEFAMASTDMGHQGQGGTWGASDPQLRVDFAYRGVHVTALVAKALIRQFYGQAPRWSYFSGCSDGGREALMEAQRYPDDFDGIAAGAQAYNFLVQNSFYHGWNWRSVTQNGTKVVLLPKDLQVLHKAVLARCDMIDGVKDGIISNPPACRFDPATVRCNAQGQTDCLSPEAVQAVRDIYAGAHDDKGAKLVIGGPQPGSELSWEGVFIPRSADGPIMSKSAASDMLRSLAYWRPLPADWDLSQFKYTTETLEGLMPAHGLYDATDPDLSPFAGRGGKLLMWHGWSDPHISPLNSVAYYQAVSDTVGEKSRQDFLRLYLIPGLYHCGGGDGLTSVDVLTPLVRWVEGGGAPESLVASRTDADAAAGKGRTLYPFPATSVLRSGADPELPASWQPGPPVPVPAKIYKAWAGAKLFEPGYEKECGFEGPDFACRPAR